jgi:hypothetical protein
MRFASRTSSSKAFLGLTLHHASHTITVACPGNETVMHPPYKQVAVDEAFVVGMPPTSVVGAVGIHEDTIGIQGIGTRTKIPGGTALAIAVAAAVAGFPKERHNPKEGMLAMGATSPIFPAGVVVRTFFVGRALREPGMSPLEHVRRAPVQS